MTRPHRLLFFDVESAPLLAHVWRAHDNYIAPERLKHDTFVLSWAAKWSDSPVIYYGRVTGDEARRQDDRRIVGQLAALMRQSDWVVAHNGDRFDIPLVNGRLLQHGMESVSAVRSIDTLKLARRSIKVASNKLDYLAGLLSLGRKLPTEFALWEAAYQGDEEALYRMDVYCRQDVRLLEKVYQRLEPYVTGMPRLQDPERKHEFACTYCGSGSVQSRGFYHTNASVFRRFRCNDCGRWSRARQAEPDASFDLRPIH